MGIKFVLSAAIVFLVLACAIEARHAPYRVQYEDGHSELSAAGRRPHPHPGLERGVSPKQQGRIFPGAVAIKKLVLLKFKKIIPISLILLKASDDNEAELVPVYPTSEIPANVQFIPTPNGISGHKDVQAIAIPTELHQQLEASGLANLENIEALLNEAEEEKPSIESNAQLAVSADKDDEPLNVNEQDEDQLLDAGASIEKVPIKTTTSSSVTNVRRLAVEDLGRPGLKASPQTAVEEIPLFLYSTKDGPQLVHSIRKGGRIQTVGRRHHA